MSYHVLRIVKNGGMLHERLNQPQLTGLAGCLGLYVCWMYMSVGPLGRSGHLRHGLAVGGGPHRPPGEKEEESAMPAAKMKNCPK